MLKKLKRGFTMIELLIVIAILGVLAVAVLAAINPIEQINRSRDNGSRSDAEQLIGAVERYYSSQGYYPWLTSPNDTPMTTEWGKVDSTWVDNATTPAQVLTKLSSATGAVGELKESFVSRVTATTYNTLYKYNAGNSGDSTFVCFLPKSLSFKKEAADRCAGTLPTDYPPAASACVASSEYICLP